MFNISINLVSVADSLRGLERLNPVWHRHILCHNIRRVMKQKCLNIQGGAVNRGLFFADLPPSLLGAVSGKISEIR
jgi:hypothetical protein